MRAVVQGMDPRASWDRYLHAEGQGGDRRQIQRTIERIKDAFAAAAQREQRPGTARLMRMDPSRFDARTQPVRPSLEEFSRAQGLEDFSEAEQVEAYEQAYPAAPEPQRGRGERAQLSRRARVIARQLDALRWLESCTARQPAPGDALRAWIAPAMAARLDRLGVGTLEQLVAYINAHGARWWRAAPGIGAGKAQRLQAWLDGHATTIGTRLGGHVGQPLKRTPGAVLVQVVPATTALVPLDKLVVPAELDGRHGLNRAAGSSHLKAGTDLEAVRAWLAAGARTGVTGRRLQPATARAYRKEAERLLLWCVLERQQALSSLRPPDMDGYFAFLSAPPAHWCGPRYGPRWSPLWRPMEGPLSEAANRQAQTILKGLFAWLVGQGWLAASPMGARKRRTSRPSVSKAMDTLRA